MRKRMSIITKVVAIACVCAAMLTTQARAAEPAVESGGSRVIMEWAEFKEISGWNEQRGDDEDKNQFVITWAEVQDLFGIEIKGIEGAELKLPWQEFKTLLEWNLREEERKRKEKEKVDPVPVPFIVQSAEYTADEISEDGAMFTGKFEIEVLEEKGWKTITLLSGAVAVLEAKLPDGVYLQLLSNMYRLQTKESGTLEVEIKFSVAVTESGGQSRLTFPKEPSTTCVVDVTIPEKDVDVNAPGAQSQIVKQVDYGTRIVAAVPVTAPISISWERAIPEAEKVPPKVYSETRTLVSVADGLLLGHSQVAFSVLHTPTRSFTLNVPDGVSVLDVTGKDIRDWRVSGSELSVQLNREAIGAVMIDVKYEKPLDGVASQANLPVITATGVEREKGHVGVVALTNVEIKGDEVTGAHLVDVKDLPPEIMGMTNQPVLLGYRYVRPEFDIALAINKHADIAILLTVIDRAHFTVMQTYDGRRITKAVYNVRNNRNQFLRLSMPEGSEIWSATVAGKSTQPAVDAEGRVLLPLVRSRAMGGLSAFPVEVVYVEEGAKPDEKGRGAALVSLPNCSEPITHLMVSLHVPEEGKYRDFDGTMRQVEAFKSIGGAVPVARPNEAAQELQQQFVSQNSARIEAAGGSSVEVSLPISGTVFRLEKILVVDDQQWFSYEFSGLD